jgi:hypothetical protein
MKRKTDTNALFGNQKRARTTQIAGLRNAGTTDPNFSAMVAASAALALKRQELRTIEQGLHAREQDVEMREKRCNTLEAALTRATFQLQEKDAAMATQRAELLSRFEIMSRLIRSQQMQVEARGYTSALVPVQWCNAY